MSHFAIYVVGFIVVIIGLAFAAHLIGVPSTWIGIGIIVLLGLGILSGVTRTKRPEP
jgi:hypothetical protein